MVNLKRKEKRMCEGHLIITDFKKLNPADFEPLYHFVSKAELREEIILLSAKGILYINSRDAISEFLSKVLEFVMKENTKTLKKYRRELKNKYPAVKGFDDWGKIAKKEGCGSKDSLECLIMLLIPIERKRRKFEFDYYGQVRLPKNESM